MLASLGKGALVSRLDIKTAFRLLHIYTSDFNFRGVFLLINASYFVALNVVKGLKTSQHF